MEQAEYTLISAPEQWASCLQALRQEPRLAVDLEANSMFAYRERVCLIQISTPAHDYIIDPLAELDYSELGQIFADPVVEKIFHAAEYDLLLLKRQYSWVVNGLFDTMWAARILGYKRFGLANLLEQFFDVKLDKRYQKSDWCRRPLSPEQLAYASFDTHFLFQLRDLLAVELEEKGCLEEAAETFVEQSQVTPSDNGFDPDDFWSIHGVNDLSRQGHAILRACNIYRDQEARRRDQPLFKILSNRTLLEISQKMPRSMDELATIHGMSGGQLRRYGRQILSVINQAVHDKPPAYPPRRERKSDAVMSRYERLHTWRKNRAQARGVESDVIVSRDALWEIAFTFPQNDKDLEKLGALGAWRRQTYGEEILRLLQNSGGDR